MHHNLKIEMERVNNQYVTQIELSTFGRCGRGRLVTATFDGALEALKAKHDELLASAQAFHAASQPAPNVTHPSEDPALQKAQAPHKFGRHELQAIAADEGIEGLRKIAGPLGVKGTSKEGLIEGILGAQQEADAPTVPEQQPAEFEPEPVQSGLVQTKEAPRQFAAAPE